MALLLHCGAAHVTYDALAQLPVPDARGSHHAVRPFVDDVDIVLDQFQSIGARVEDTAYGVLSRDGLPARFFGLIELRLPNVADDDFGLMVGLRGSYDQTLPRGLAVGSRVFVCDNLAFSGEVTIKTKQTTYIGQRLPRLITQAVGRIPALALAQSAKFDAYRNTTIGQRAGNRISLKGRIFTMPDGSTHAGPISAVILDWRNYNAFWNTPYNPQQLTDPVCFALSREFGDLAPSADATTPQAEHCAVCPRNVFGSAPNGKAKSCKNTRRLAIVPPDATLETEPMILTASPTAISAFESYLLGLATEGKMPVEVVTHIAFKPDTDFPTLVFGKPKPLTDRQLAMMMGLRAKAQLALDMTGARAANEEAGR